MKNTYAPFPPGLDGTAFGRVAGAASGHVLVIGPESAVSPDHVPADHLQPTHGRVHTSLENTSQHSTKYRVPISIFQPPRRTKYLQDASSSSFAVPWTFFVMYLRVE